MINEKMREVLINQIKHKLLDYGLVAEWQCSPRIIEIDEALGNGYFIFNYNDYIYKGKFSYFYVKYKVRFSNETLMGYKVRHIEIMNEVTMKWNDDKNEFDYEDIINE